MTGSARHGFDYVDGVLHAERLPLPLIADAVGTPFYCYSTGAIVAAYREFAAALAGLPATICYALKANSNQAVIATLAAEGAGADVVSGGEVARALAAGVPASRIVFAGVGKTEAEIADALDVGIGQFNAESVDELQALSRVAAARGREAQVALRINPNVDARTHAKITTGKAENKFGVDAERVDEVFALARDLPGIAMHGLAVHIGSQLTELAPYRDAFALVAELTRGLRAGGHRIDQLDLGGGIGIGYDGSDGPSFAAYAEVVRETVGNLDCQLVFEPGRSLVGPAGVLVTRVVRVKHGRSRRFVILDAAMNDLVRPALYDVAHRLVPVRDAGDDAGPADVVGPVCETGDTFARATPLPSVEAGDLMAFRDAGAYGAVMAFTYNTRPLVPEVMVRGDDYAIVRPRQEVDALIAMDRLPPWLAVAISDQASTSMTRKRGAA